MKTQYVARFVGRFCTKSNQKRLLISQIFAAAFLCVSSGVASAATLTWYFDLEANVTSAGTANIAGSFDFDTDPSVQTASNFNIGVAGVTANGLTGLPMTTPALNGAYELSNFSNPFALRVVRDLNGDGAIGVGDAGLFLRFSFFPALNSTTGSTPISASFGFCSDTDCNFYQVGTASGTATNTPPNPSPVPLPAALPLLMLALGGLGFAARRKAS